MRTNPLRMLALVALLLAAPRVRADSARYEVRPGQDYRTLLNRLQPGDELVFLPGEHEGAAILDLQGQPGRPITLRGQVGARGRRPVVQFTGRGQNLWRLRGRHLVVRDLELHATHAYAIRVDRAEHVRIEHCTFRDCGGGDLSANSADVHALHVVHCTFTGSRRTPVYIGHHDGRLQITDFRFEGNRIDGRRIEGGIGYGIQLKLNVTGGQIRGNWISGTRGPGIMVYGARQDDPDLANVVEGNVVLAARNNPGIVVGGGPARIRGNLVADNPQGGIAVIDYGGRDLLGGIQIHENTLVANGSFDLSFRGNLRELRAEQNRIVARPGGPGIRGPQSVLGRHPVEPAGEALRQRITRLRDTEPVLRSEPLLPPGPLDAAELNAWLDRWLEDSDAANSDDTSG